ncbi:MAG: methylenetetrahydrofolate reductase, partial [Desulfobacterales bacterium]
KVKGKVDAFLVPEMSNAVMRMSSLGGAMVLQSKGVETVMQVCCRDRNRIALQADLLAACACGITTVMAVTGQEPGYGDHHQARSVYDIDLLGLLAALAKLQGGRDMAGIELAGAPDFLVGAAVNAGAPDISPEVEAEEMKKMIDAGVRFFVTPPLFSLEPIAPVLKRIDRDKVHIIPTVLLLKSLGMARYMARNVAHVQVPEALVDRLQQAPDKVRECVRISRETIAAFRSEGFSGVLLSTIGWEHKIGDMLEGV